MIKIFRPRQRGKTTALIKMSEATGSYIMTSTRMRARCIFQMANEMGCNIPNPIIVEDYFRSGGMRDSFIKDILIDDADDVLRTIFRNVNIEAITMTYENCSMEDDGK